LTGTVTAQSTRLTRATLLSLVCVAAFPVLLTILHVLEPELDPSRELISTYEIGHHGWVMRLAFFSFAAGVLALSVAMSPNVRTPGGRVGVLLLRVVAAGLVVAGTFALGVRHAVGFVLVVPVFPVAAVLLAISLRRTCRLFAMTILVWAGFFSFFFAGPALFSALTDRQWDTVIGYPNRFMMCGYALWCLVAAWQARTAVRRSPAERSTTVA